jgi:hypothetical protein
MATFHLSIRPCIFAIFKPTIFIFWILIEDCITINETFGFFDSLSISSEIELGLGPSKIEIYLIKFKVDPMIYFGSSNYLKKAKWRKKSRWPPSMNFPFLRQFLCKSIETWNMERRS